MTNPLSALFARAAAALRRSPPPGKSPPARTPPVGEPLVGDEFTGTELKLFAACNDFAFELLRQVHPQESSPNTFLSPLGASMTLAMALNGAAGDTFDAMRATLGFDSLTQDEINRSFRDLMTLLTGLDPGVTLLMSNAAFAHRSHPFSPSLPEVVGHWFDAEARTLDFDDPSAVGIINRWASDHTQGLIPAVIDSLSAAKSLLLLNAVYFKGRWDGEFDNKHTAPRPFTLADGERVQVQTLMDEVPAGLHSMRDVVVGELQYDRGMFVMDVVLPQGDATLDDLIAGLDARTWADWTADLDWGKSRVTMPKLTLETGTTLDTPLRNMGMGIAFDPGRADLSPMITPPADAYIDSVKQRAYVKVDEKGTTSTAAAFTTMSLGIHDPAEPRVVPPLTVDHPYLLLIRERLTEIILFIGAITDPRAAQ